MSRLYTPHMPVWHLMMLRLLPTLLSLAFLTILFAGTAYAAVPLDQDITPPTLVDVSFEPAHIDTGDRPVTMTVMIHVLDDLSGVSQVGLYFRKPGTSQVAQVHYGLDGWSKIIKGDPRDGYVVESMTLPQYAAYGRWELTDAILSDNVGNRIDYDKPADGSPIDESTWPSRFDEVFFTNGPVERPRDTLVYMFLPAVTAQ